MTVQRGVVAEGRGVADLGVELLELVEGLLLGVLPHPVELVDRRAIGGDEVVDQLIHHLLRRRREVSRDVDRTDGLADRVLDEGDAALPALAQLRGAVEGAAVEVEVGLDEGLGEVGRRAAEDPRVQDVAPGLDRRLLQHRGEVLEEVGLHDDGRGQRLLVATERGDIGDPVEGRAQLLELGEALVVGGLLHVAGRGSLPVTLGQPGLVRQQAVGGTLRVGVPAEGQQGDEVGEVLLADLGELVLAVVGLVRQAEPALREVDDVARGVDAVRGDVGAEQARAADALEAAEEGGQLAEVVEGVGAVEEVLHRLEATRLDGLGVHEGGVEGADLALVLVEPVGGPRGERR